MQGRETAETWVPPELAVMFLSQVSGLEELAPGGGGVFKGKLCSRRGFWRHRSGLGISLISVLPLAPMDSPPTSGRACKHSGSRPPSPHVLKLMGFNRVFCGLTHPTQLSCSHGELELDSLQMQCR